MFLRAEVGLIGPSSGERTKLQVDFEPLITMLGRAAHRVFIARSGSGISTPASLDISSGSTSEARLPSHAWSRREGREKTAEAEAPAL